MAMKHGSGDARYESPGYSAKYGSYSLMGQKSNKIITTQLVHVSEAGSSNGCEKEGRKGAVKSKL